MRVSDEDTFAKTSNSTPLACFGRTPEETWVHSLNLVANPHNEHNWNSIENFDQIVGATLLTSTITDFCNRLRRLKRPHFERNYEIKSWNRNDRSIGQWLVTSCFGCTRHSAISVQISVQRATRKMPYKILEQKRDNLDDKKHLSQKSPNQVKITEFFPHRPALCL